MKSYPSIPLPPSVFNLQSHPFELQVWHGAKWSVGIVNSPHLVVTHFSLQYFEESSKKWKIQYRPSEIQNHKKFGVQSYKIFIHCTWVTVPLLLALLLAPSLPSSSIRKYWLPAHFLFIRIVAWFWRTIRTSSQYPTPLGTT